MFSVIAREIILLLINNIKRKCPNKHFVLTTSHYASALILEFLRLKNSCLQKPWLKVLCTKFQHTLEFVLWSQLSEKNPKLCWNFDEIFKQTWKFGRHIFGFSASKSHRSKSLLQIFALLLQIFALLLQIFALLLQIFALFWVMFGINCTRINQSQPRNISLYIIIFWKYFKLSLNVCFVSKKTQVANNGTAWNCWKTLISQSDYGKNILKTIVSLRRKVD